MAIDFPNSPSNGDIHTVSGKRWQWDGEKWQAYGASLAAGVLFVDQANSRVGINDTTPSYSLDVNGTARVTGAITASGGVVGNVTGNASGTALTVTQAAQSAITSVGTLTGLTLSGDLVVDTDCLFVDVSENRVGINTTSPVLTGLTIGRQPSDANEGGQVNWEGGTSFSNNLSIDRYGNDLRLLYNGSQTGTWSGAGALVATAVTSSGAVRAVSGGADGGMVVGQAYSSSYVGLRTNGMSSTSADEYVLLSDGTHTFLGSGTSGDTYIRGAANATTHQLKIGSAGAEFSGKLIAAASDSYPIAINVGLTAGAANIAIGTGNLSAATGTNNVAVGYAALNNCTTSGWNVAVGNYALGSTTTQSGHPNYAQYSTALGHEALYGNVNGSGGNIGIGFRAGKTTTTGLNNIWIGMQCGNGGATTGSSNTAMGYNAFQSSTTAIGDVCIGAYAGQDATEALNLVAVGYLAGTNVTTGDDNIAIGTQALYTNTTSDDNVAVGFQSLFYATNISNVGLGSYAGHWITTGHTNTMIGYYSGQGYPTTGDNNSCLGYSAQPVAADTNNSVTLGNTAIATLRCQVTSITAISDERDKTDIQDFDMGLDFVRRLRPRRFVWDMRDGGKVGIEDTGFIAQELQQAQADEGKTIPNLILDENPDKLEAAMATLIPALVQAIQELDDKVEALS
jgi:hypothetical protein